MIKVELINPEVLSNLTKSHGEFSCECYGTNKKYSEKVGEVCQESGHMSGSRTEYIKFNVSGCDRGTSEQALRHELGVRFDDFVDVSIDPTMIVKNMKSFRYVDMSKNFDYTIPKLILKSERATDRYNLTMSQIQLGLKEVKDILDEEFPNVDNKVKLEATQFQLPRATNTSFTIGFTLEALFHYMGKRLCTRTQPEHRGLTMLMRDEVLKIKPDLKNKLVSICDYLLWCPENSMCCGRRPTKNMLIQSLEQN